MSRAFAVPKLTDEYALFEHLDGSHPYKNAVPEGVVEYRVRQLPTGRVSYFNFELAREMGLIPAHHPNVLNSRLEDKIIETFALRIINEYDDSHQIEYPKSAIKKNTYMATRYLQLQHPSKTGKTSGDGRCIWNGTVEHKGITWDVSSRGTGVTCLAPGAVEAGKPLRSGSTNFGYGCGLAEIDELYGAALMSEIFHNNSIPTERMLCIVDLGRGVGIGVRAGHNLLRPAHFFMFLKQNNHSALKRATDYFIERQTANGRKKLSTSKKYQNLLNAMCEDFSRFAATLEREYIFAWMEWDGDNVLADAGIIDYGSVRQFGLRHDQYRYDDIERFSTTLGEQRKKVRMILQVYCQMISFVETGERKRVSEFSNHPLLEKFDILFSRNLSDRFLYQLGFELKSRDFLLLQKRQQVDQFTAIYQNLEMIKTSRPKMRVADGVNRPPLLNMRTFNRQWMKWIKDPDMCPKHIALELLSTSATRKDRKRVLDPKIQKLIVLLLKHTQRLFSLVDVNETAVLNRSQKINRPDRMTGNALINVVHHILEHRKKGFKDRDIQKVMDVFIAHQSGAREIPKSWTERSQRLMQTLLTVVGGYHEDI